MEGLFDKSSCPQVSAAIAGHLSASPVILASLILIPQTVLFVTLSDFNNFIILAVLTVSPQPESLCTALGCAVMQRHGTLVLCHCRNGMDVGLNISEIEM